MSNQVQVLPKFSAPAQASPALPVSAIGDAVTSVGAKVDPNVEVLKNAMSGTEWGKLNLGIPKWALQALNTLQGPLGVMESFIKILEPIMSVIELLISSFSSFAKVISSLIEMIQSTVSEFAKSFGTAGVYMNVLVPPAFMPENVSNFDLMKMSNGGFQGFLARLQASLQDATDKSRPVFGPGDYVGGMVIVVDAPGVGQFFESLSALAQMFDFVKLFGINLSPPPPRNVRGRPGYFKDEKTGLVKFGIEVEWDKAPLSSGGRYVIARSQQPGGTPITVEDKPTSLLGYLQILKKARANNTDELKWPTKQIRVYDDPGFHDGKYWSISEVMGAGVYIDYEMGGKNDGKSVFEPNYTSDNPKERTPMMVNYVVYSGYGDDKPSNLSPKLPGNVGPASTEAGVEVRWCTDVATQVNLVEHPGGYFELLLPGQLKLGSWTGMQLKFAAPFVEDIAEFINGILESIKGGFTDASDSFIKFVEQVKQKIQNYIQLITLVIRVLNEIKEILTNAGKNAAFLFVPPAVGGNAGFIKTVTDAKVPEGMPPFSGPDGVTAGIILMYGLGAGGAAGAVDPALAAQYKAQFEVVKKAFEAIGEVFS